MKATRGMTIAELLIALLVISVLFILGLPALKSSRENSLSSKCLHHLRQVGVSLFTYAADHQQTIPSAWNDGSNGRPTRAWATRLVYEGYIDNPDILFCPAYFPRNDAEADRKASVYQAIGPQVYGMRNWVEPGTGWLTTELQKGARKLTAIQEPADFFILVDSVWTYLNSQGYAVTPGDAIQNIHLRHRQKANALFADGHVEAKPADYFSALNRADRQRIYTGNQDRSFNMTSEMKFPR